MQDNAVILIYARYYYAPGANLINTLGSRTVRVNHDSCATYQVHNLLANCARELSKPDLRSQSHKELGGFWVESESDS